MAAAGLPVKIYRVKQLFLEYRAVQCVNGQTGDVVLNAADVSAVPIPTTASVGQVLVVKPVDENGKPTEFEE